MLLAITSGHASYDSNDISFVLHSALTASNFNDVSQEQLNVAYHDLLKTRFTPSA